MRSWPAIRNVFRGALVVATTAAAALVGAVPVHARGPPPSLPPSVIQTTHAGTPQSDGTYLWEWKVFAGQKPSLSHWLLHVCEDIFDSVVAGSVVGGPLSYGYDGSTGETGLKFDSGGSDGQILFYSFKTTVNWQPEYVMATFKAGRNITNQEGALAPGCEPSPVPEPGTLALLAGGAPFLPRRRRRTRA